MGPEVKPRNRSVNISESKGQDGTQLHQLREELNRCSMKIAQLQARLVSTLDELDSQRHQHQHELKSERRTREKLSNKLDAYLEEVRRAERERDDLRELVAILLEKVEACHNYSAWPCPRIELASPLASSLHMDDVEDPDATTRDEDPLPGAMVALLQKKLADERRAHALTKQEADAEILRLKAMIARRDAELEACATHDAHRVLLSSIQNQVQNARQRHGPSLKCYEDPANHPSTHEASTGIARHADQIVASTAIRNRTLEREVELLRHEIHKTQHKRDTHSVAGGAARLAPAEVERRHASVQVEEFPEDHSNLLPPSPGLLPHAMPYSPSPYTLTPQHGLGLTRSSSARPKSSLGLHDSITLPDYNVQTLENDINRLSAQIDAFVSERNAMKGVLAREIKAPSLAVLSCEPPSHSEILQLGAHFEECASERRDLRERLESLARERDIRERRLEEEIRSLQQTIRELHCDHDVQPSSHHAHRYFYPRYAPAPGDTQIPSKQMSPRASPTLVPTDAAALRPTSSLNEESGDQLSQHLHRQRDGHLEPPPFSSADGDELGEISMELATPVQTTILSLREEEWPSPPTNHAVEPSQIEPVANPADIPLPVSPEGQASTAPASFSPSSSHSPPLVEDLSPPLYIAPPRAPSTDLLARIESITDGRVASIERQIAVTHRQLEDKEAALADLRVTAAQFETPLHPRENADGDDAERI